MSSHAKDSWRCAKAFLRPEACDGLDVDHLRHDCAGRSADVNSGRRATHADAAGDAERVAWLVLRAARYGRNGQLDTTALDAALENGTEALKKLRIAKLWPMRAAGALARIRR